MAAALNTFRPLLSIPWMQSFPFLSTAALGGFALPQTFQLGLPSLASLQDVLSPWLLAVPKKKTSHSKKAMRASNKGLTDKTSCVAYEVSTRGHAAHPLATAC